MMKLVFTHILVALHLLDYCCCITIARNIKYNNNFHLHAAFTRYPICNSNAGTTTRQMNLHTVPCMYGEQRMTNLRARTSTRSSTMRMMVVHDQSRASKSNKKNIKRRKRKKSGHKQNQKHNQNSQNAKHKEKQKPRIKYYTDEQIEQMSIGQAIQESTSIQQLLITASRMWIPTDDNLPQHIIHQSIHHEKRFRSSCLLLSKLSDYIGTINPTTKATMNSLWSTNNDFKRVILAATLPFESSPSTNSGIDIEKECRFVTIALVAIYTIAGHTLPPLSRMSMTTLSPPIPTSSDTDVCSTIIDKDIFSSIQTLIDRAETLARKDFTLNQAIEARWAIRGLFKRIPKLNGGHENRTQNQPNLDKRVQNLPFDIIPQSIDWMELEQQYHKLQQQNDNDIIKTLLQEIPFSYDTIATRSGSLVQERRSTAWIAEDGIGSLAYSGKLMTPQPIPPFVRYTMRAVENSIVQNYDKNDQFTNYMDYMTQLKLCMEETGGYFDCALTNHYPDFDSACKFHTDPEHGSFWERLTCVVSAGEGDIRKFAFRPIPQVNDWSKWEDENVLKHLKGQLGIEYRGDDGGIGIEPAVIHLFPGDCVIMWGACNDIFHHAVYGADRINHDKNDHDPKNPELKDQIHNDGRVSLVFKRAMDRGNGRRGHGRKGEGRRSRRM